jgi:hypothetical protein
MDQIQEKTAEIKASATGSWAASRQSRHYDLIELGPLRPLYLLLGEGLVKSGH